MLHLDGSVSSTLLEIARTGEVRSTLEERFSDYCHACSNRLNSLKLSLYLAQRQPAGRSDRLLQTANERYQLLEQQFELFRAVCRPFKLSPVQLDLALLIEDRRVEWTKILAESGVQLVFEPPGLPVEVRIDADRLGQALDEMVRWRASVCRPGVVVTLEWGWQIDSAQARWAHLIWREFSVRSNAGRPAESHVGSTWALPVLTRVLTEHGGSVSCHDQGGWQAELLWPTCPDLGPS